MEECSDDDEPYDEIYDDYNNPKMTEKQQVMTTLTAFFSNSFGNGSLKVL